VVVGALAIKAHAKRACLPYARSALPMQAADWGDAAGQFNLGGMHYKAADKGNANALKNLGVCIRTSIGWPRTTSKRTSCTTSAPHKSRGSELDKNATAATMLVSSRHQRR